MLYYKISHEYQFIDIDQSVSWAEKAITEAKRLKFKKGVAYSLIQIGNIEQIRANYTKAESYNLEALDILRKIGDRAGEAICFNNLGIIYHDRNEYSRALSYYHRSLITNRELGRKPGEAISLFCIGTVYENMARYDSALVFYFAGQEISEDINDSKLMAYADVSLANVYYSMQDYQKAWQYNIEASKLYERAGNKLGQIKVYNALGQLAVLKDSLDKAVWFYTQSLNASREIQSNNDVSYSLFSLAQVYERRGMTDSAFNMYREAYKAYSNEGSTENAAHALISMARIENGLKNYEKAGGYLIEAYNLADSAGTPKVLMDVNKEIALTFYGLKDYKSAFLYYRNYSDLKDSVMNLERQNQILDLQTRYETEKKEKENRLLKQEQRILQMTRNFLLAGAGMLLVIAFLILRNLRIKKKDNELLRKQKEEIRQQKEIVEEQKKEITDSIRYARRIQSAILPSEELVKSVAPESFILYLPRDIVSGDFYLLRSLDDQTTVICAADCTGHGVPGAFMSMLGLSLLSDIINNNKSGIIAGTCTSADILGTLRVRVKDALSQTGKEGEAKDGMDMSLCIINRRAMQMHYAGANNSVYIISEGSLTELKSTRNPIGIYVAEKDFVNNIITINPGSAVYLFSDGYSDQISTEGSKFLSKNLKHFLEEIAYLPMEQQHELLLQKHLAFRGTEEQVDDILLIGIRI
jgi:serine phosphatase RsbU (regulator of sigma subunit)